jgi:dolichol kinase
MFPTIPALAFDEVPWWRVATYLVLSTLVLGNVATALRRRWQWADGYSRKLNHVGIMLITLPLLAFLPDRQLLPAIFTGSLGLIAIYAVSAASSRPLLFGIVSGSLRQRDAPYSRFFFFLPLVSFNLALSASTLLFPMDMVRAAFYTVALADGLAEPVGLRFGPGNTFRIRDPLWKRYNTKSVAGSSTVLLVAFAIGLTMLAGNHGLSPATVAAALAYGLVTAIVEALSPRGLDNLLLAAVCPVALSVLVRVMV